MIQEGLLFKAKQHENQLNNIKKVNENHSILNFILSFISLFTVVNISLFLCIYIA